MVRAPGPGLPHRHHPRSEPSGGQLHRWLAPLVLLGTCLAASGVPAQQSYDIALREGRLSIRANAVPVIELAEALSSETGVSFVVTGAAELSITTEIIDEPLDKAVAKLFPNHLVVRDGKRAGAPITEIVLLLDEETGGDGGEGFLPSGAPADGIVGGEEELAQPGMEGGDVGAGQEFSAAPQPAGSEGYFESTGGDPLEAPSEEPYQEEPYQEEPYQEEPYVE